MSTLPAGRQVEDVTVTDEQRDAFLDLLEEDPHLGDARALRLAGVEGTKGQLKQWLAAHDDELGDLIDQARGKRIRTELLRRAIDGVEKGIYHQGALVATETEYSDRLLEFAARMYLPEAKALRGIEVTGRDGGPVEVTNPELNAAVERFTATVRRLAERAQDAQPGGDVRDAAAGPAALPPAPPSD